MFWQYAKKLWMKSRTRSRSSNLIKRLRTLFSSTAGQGVENTKWPAVLIFSVNFTNRKNLAKPNYHVSIKKSQAILKCFIDLIAFGSRWAQKTKERIRPSGHLVFSTPWPAVELKKVVLRVVKHDFVFWAQRNKPNAILEIYKAFQDRLTFLSRQMISWNVSILWNLLRT